MYQYRSHSYAFNTSILGYQSTAKHGIDYGADGSVREGFNPINGDPVAVKVVTIKSKIQIPRVGNELTALQKLRGNQNILGMWWSAPSITHTPHILNRQDYSSTHKRVIEGHPQQLSAVSLKSSKTRSANNELLKSKLAHKELQPKIHAIIGHICSYSHVRRGRWLCHARSECQRSALTYRWKHSIALPTSPFILSRAPSAPPVTFDCVKIRQRSRRMMHDPAELWRGRHAEKYLHSICQCWNLWETWSYV